MCEPLDSCIAGPSKQPLYAGSLRDKGCALALQVSQQDFDGNCISGEFMLYSRFDIYSL